MENKKIEINKAQARQILSGLHRQKQYFLDKILQNNIDFKDHAKARQVYNRSAKQDIGFIEEIEAGFYKEFPELG